MRVLVTGASSYIAQYIINKLLSDGVIVVAISRRNIDINHKNYIHKSLDLRFDEIPIDDYDFIIHMAAQSRLDKSALEYYESNILITKRVSEFAIKVKPKAIIYTSSIKVYGEILDKVVDENTSIRNPDLYGLTKYFGEKLLSEAAPTINLRLPGVITKGSHGWINSIFEKLLINKDITIFNSPYNHVVHSYDIYKIISILLNYKNIKSDSYNVCASGISSSKEVVYLMKKLLNSKSKVSLEDSDGINHTISNEKLRSIYTPMDVEDSMKMFLEDMNS